MMEENTTILGTSKTSITTTKWNNIANAESSTLPPSSSSHSFWLSIRCNPSGNTTVRRTSHTQTANHLHNQLIATFKLELTVDTEMKQTTYSTRTSALTSHKTILMDLKKLESFTGNHII